MQLEGLAEVMQPVGEDGARMPSCSIVVPAHDEAAILEERLGPLVSALAPGEAEVVVVANGCTDRTAEVASRLPGVRVLQTEVASKAVALDLGDRAVTAFPRVFLDADVRLSPVALRALVAALDTDRAVVATPRVTFDVRGASWPVRAFHDVFSRLPYVQRGLVGLGVYGLSEAGRARFESFPRVVADDHFVQRLFADDERVGVDASFEVVAPRTTAALLKVRTRVVRGNRELAHEAAALGLTQEATPGTVGALLRLVARYPRLLPAAVVYLAVVLAARYRAAGAGATTEWERDASTRDGALGAGDAPGGRVLVDGVPFDPLTEGQVVDRVMGALADGRGGTVVTPNVDIHRRLRLPEFRDVLDGADLLVPDGMPLVWASRLAGTPLPERVTGASLIWSLSAGAALNRRSVYLLGAASGVAGIAAQRLVARLPELTVAGWYSPPLGFEMSPAQLEGLADRLREAGPDLVFVALGFPKQERLIARMREVLPSAWFIGCGASVDFVAGRVRRAPYAVQTLGLEWVFRLAQEPRRLARRYLVDDAPHAVALLARAAALRIAPRNNR